MGNETLEATTKGIAQLVITESDLTALDLNVVIALINQPLDMLGLVNRIRTTSRERKFIDARYIAASVSKLVKRGYLKYNGMPAEIRLDRKARRAANYAR